MTIHVSIPVSPPYALTTPAFRFRALASLAGRAPMGGPREVALATYLAARLVDDCQPAKMLPGPARAERAAFARTWLASVTLPAAIRSSLLKLIDATGDDGAPLASILEMTLTSVDSFLDAPSRLELQRLTEQFRQ